MYFEKLTELDKKRIENYIDYNVGCLTSPLEEVLAPWDKAKSGYLSKIFGDKLIIKEHVSFEEGFSDISGKIYEMLWSDKRCNKFREAITDICYNEWYAKFNYGDPERNYYYFVTDHLFNEYTFYTNSISLRHYVENDKKYFDLPIKNKIFRIQEGMKPMRVIAKIAQEYGVGIVPDENGISDFEHFRRIHSQCLNTKTLCGELCLSIHPLDYMTMSDNNCGWDSCMSWTNDGEYKQGTVEMMNSPCVVVGYLASDTPYYWEYQYNTEDREEDECWNGKKWRCLFIVDKDFIINVKGYPYENDNLVKAAIAKLTELARWGNAKAVKYEYLDWSTHRRDKIPCVINGRDVAIDFATQAMYNDFGSCNHFIVLNPKDKGPIIDYRYLYSGVSECVRCGNTDSDEIGESQGEGELSCDRCVPKFYCDCCDERYDGDYYTTADGSKVCDYCWNNCTIESDLDGRTYLNENIREIILADRENEKFDSCLCESINVHRDNIGSCAWEDCFKISAPREKIVDTWGDVCYYVYPSDCTKEGLSLFDINSEEELKNYMCSDEHS